MDKIIIHYCCGTMYRGEIGGVPRYDYQISLAFPKRIFLEGPKEKNKLLNILNSNKNAIVITDNHLACDIPNEYNCILVHHGCAMTTSERNPDWGEPWKSLCTNGQNTMLNHRNTNNTLIITISQSCTDDFTYYYGDLYTKFNRLKVLHPSEFDENKFKKKWNDKPIVLGNWIGIKKGSKVINYLSHNIDKYKFKQLQVYIDNNGIDNFNERKQNIYLNCDIFLQISNSEGNSYATLDALLCGLVVVSSNVGLFYNDVPEDCFVKIEWQRNNDADYIKSKLDYAWENKEILTKKAREWYFNNCRLNNWIQKMKDIVDNFQELIKKNDN